MIVESIVASLWFSNRILRPERGSDVKEKRRILERHRDELRQMYREHPLSKPELLGEIQKLDRELLKLAE